ncbi:hypothetical protein C0J52_27304 [Blattella germanica]|nr:hypothetical protein C0J52_27304 [Blattella germanica]
MNMNSRRVQSSISRLQKDVDNCEMFVSKNIKNKIDKSKSNTLKRDQNTDSVGSRERSVMTYVTSPRPKTPELPTWKPNSHKTTSNSAGSRVLCKEVFENNNATVEVTVKAKTSSTDKSRKRTRSNTALSVAETDASSKSGVRKEANAQLERPAPSKVNRKGSTPKKVQTHSRNKHLSWAHILKDNNIPCAAHAEKSNVEPERPRKKFTHSSKNAQRRFHADNSAKSTETSESSCSSDQNSICYVDRSVQCHLLKNVGGSSKQEDNTKASVSSKLSSNTDGYSSFSMYNPVRTLNFLIKELRGKVKKCDSDKNMQKILSDIEQALTRIPLDCSIQDTKENMSDIPSRDVNVATKQSNLGFVPLKPADPTMSKTVLAPRAKLPEQESAPRQQSKTSVQLSPPVRGPSHSELMQQGLEVRCAQLELNLGQLDIKYEKQRKENKALVEQMKNLKEQFDMVTSREKDYLTTINYLRSNLETMTKRSEDQAKSISEMSDIQIFVSDQLLNLKADTFNGKGKELLNEAFAGSKQALDSDMDSVTLFFEKSNVASGGGGNGKRLVCSSPTSSALSSSGVESSWQKISRISSSSEKDMALKKSSLEVLVLSPPRKGRMKESEDEIDIMGDHKSFPVMKSDSPEFKSFLLESWSETMKLNSNNQANTTEPKSCEDLKNELRDFFERIKKEASKGLDLSLPSPPHFYSQMSEPGGMSQWSDASEAESLQNSAFFSLSNNKLKKQCESTTDASIENKSEKQL